MHRWLRQAFPVQERPEPMVLGGRVLVWLVMLVIGLRLAATPLERPQESSAG